MVCPIKATASMSIPDLVDPTLTLAHTRSVTARASGMEAIRMRSDKITRYAEHLVSTGEAIEKEFGIPIVNKRISLDR